MPPTTNLPVPRDVTYSGTSIALSPEAKALLVELANKLVRGSSVSVVGYARGNATLARERALVVIDFLKSRVAIRVSWRIVTSDEVGRATVTTLKL
jgi:outer membrane protein OmpA-like peptidoglycan-associated protein